MPNTYTLISSNTLTTTTASITFSSIPGTYTDLLITASTRNNNTGAGGQDNSIAMWINGVITGTSYSATALLSAFNSPTSSRQTSVASWAYMGSEDTATNTATTFASNEYYIPSYTAAQHKPVSVSARSEDNSSGSASIYYSGAYAGLFRDTAAITSITLSGQNGDFVSGSSFYLYGIKNS
jgi:hypothetical protein